MYNSHMIRPLMTGCLSLLLAACQLLPQTDTAIPAITTVTLNRDFPIRGYRSSEYVQGGEIQPYESISQYYPHCKLELRKIADIERILKPETFTVTRTHRQEEFAGFREIMLAGDGSSGLIMSTTYLYLQSEQQPGIFRLSCMRLDESFYAQHVSVTEMQDTLGGLLTLSMAGTE